jgi:transposase
MSPPDDNGAMKNVGDIKLALKQARKVYVFEKLQEGKMTNAEAAFALKLSVRQIQRIKKAFETKRHEAFQHGNTGRKPAHAFGENLKKRVLEVALLYRETSCQHISELIMEHDGVCISAKSIIRILKEKGIDLACAHKGARRRQRRERRKKRGELVQIDASPFDWLSDGVMRSLHGAIDDATGEVVALWLAETEQINGYFHVLENMIQTSGVPRALYMDGHTIFYSPLGGKLTEEEELEGKTVALTQFGNVLDILGIQPIRACSPQAKGRVERLWRTLQMRLPVDMRVEGIRGVEEANRFLREYIKRHNDRFAVEASDAESAYQPGPPGALMRFILCVREKRKTAGDSSISWKGKTYVIEEEDGEQRLFSRGSAISVLTLMDGSIAAQHGVEILSVREIARKTKIEKKEIIKEEKDLKKAYKPAPDHPWRKLKIHPAASGKSPKTAA